MRASSRCKAKKKANLSYYAIEAMHKASAGQISLGKFRHCSLEQI